VHGKELATLIALNTVFLTAITVFVAALVADFHALSGPSTTPTAIVDHAVSSRFDTHAAVVSIAGH
jgi:hypothetical protein